MYQDSDPINANWAAPDEEIPKIRTRSGYDVGEVIRAFQVTLGETGPAAAGRCIHYSADIICSGALQIWMRYCMEYAIDHIGSGAPRIFMYLKKRFDELQSLATKNDAETLYSCYEFQAKVGEIVLILKDCVRRTKVALPKIHHSCFNDAWLAEARSTRTNFVAVQRTFKQGNDSISMNIVGNEVVKAVEEGATEKALFWMRWLLDTDAALKKNNSGFGLTTLVRGPPGWPEKMRTSVSFYLCNIAAETYKDLAERGKMRMNEEFAALVDLYRFGSNYKAILTARRRLDLLCLMFQLLCEVPRWHVQAAAALVKDAVVLRKGLVHVENFFREVLSYKMPPGQVDIIKEANRTKNIVKKKMSEKGQKADALTKRLAAFDAAVDDFMSK